MDRDSKLGGWVGGGGGGGGSHEGGRGGGKSTGHKRLFLSFDGPNVAYPLYAAASARRDTVEMRFVGTTVEMGFVGTGVDENERDAAFDIDT